MLPFAIATTRSSKSLSPHVSTATGSGNNLNRLNLFKWLEAHHTDTQLDNINPNRELMHPIFKTKSPTRARFMIHEELSREGAKN